MKNIQAVLLARWAEEGPAPCALGDFPALPSDALEGRPRRSSAGADDPVVAALKARGDVLSSRPDGGFNIRCPWEHEHTTAPNGTDCSYWPAHTGGYSGGGFKCQHAHCADRTAADLRRALGIVDDSPGLKLVSMADLMSAELPEPEFCIEPWIPKRQTTLLAGHGGLGKSYLALVLAAHVAAGVALAGLAVTQGRVLFVTLEDEPRLVRWRLRNVIESYKLDPGTVLANIALLDGTEAFTPLITVGDGANSKPEFTAAFDSLRGHAKGHSLVVVDNASDGFDANENVRRHVRQFIHGLSDLAREHDAGVLLLAHVDKSAAKYGPAGNSYSGSTAWHNSARSRLALINVDGALTVAHEKNNLGKTAGPMPLTLGFGGVPMPGNSQQFDVSRDLLNWFEVAEQAGHAIPANLRPGNGSAMLALTQLPGYPPRWQSKSGKEEVARVLNGLRAEGLLVEREYRDDNRKLKRELSLTPEGRARIQRPAAIFLAGGVPAMSKAASSSVVVRR